MSIAVSPDLDEILKTSHPSVVRVPDPTASTSQAVLTSHLTRKIEESMRHAQEEAIAALGGIPLDPIEAGKRIRSRIGLVGPVVLGDLSSLLARFGHQVIVQTKRVMGATKETSHDREFAEGLSTSQGAFLRDSYGRMGASIASLATEALQSPAGFTRGQLDALLADEMTARSRAYAEVAASVYVTRSRSWGQISALEDAHVERWRFQAKMDAHTCFPAGTKVLMASGRQKEIEKIAVGDMVISCTGAARKVAGINKTWTKRWMRIGVKKHGVMSPTYSHLILTNKGWIRAEKLVPGDQVVTYIPASAKPGSSSNLWAHEREWQGRLGRMDPRTINVGPWPHSMLHRLAVFAEVESVEKLWEHDAAYDFEVEEDHGYIVNGLIVHNSDGCRLLNGSTFSVRQSFERMLQAAGGMSETRDLLPFLREEIVNGETCLTYRTSQGSSTLAIVDQTGRGTTERGSYRHVQEASLLEASGIANPPNHFDCRSQVRPA